MARVKLTTTQVKKLRKLLDMWYRPSELAEEMSMHVNTIYRLVEQGCPHKRQGRHVFIRGTVFRDWVIGNRDTSKTHLAEDEALCMHCRVPRKFTVVKVTRMSRKREQVEGRCAVCSGTVYRFRAARRRTPDPDHRTSDQTDRQGAKSE
jgi:hypothetical protein